MLGLALNRKARKRIHYIAIGVIAETSYQYEFSFCVVGKEPDPLRPFAGAGRRMIEGGSNLVAQEFVVLGQHDYPPFID
jgi:hypothetical protein